VVGKHLGTVRCAYRVSGFICTSRANEGDEHGWKHGDQEPESESTTAYDRQ